MHYSIPKDGPYDRGVIKADWNCTKCGAHNFKRRDFCFKCNTSREEADQIRLGEGYDEVSNSPCNSEDVDKKRIRKMKKDHKGRLYRFTLDWVPTCVHTSSNRKEVTITTLLFRNLDILTTEEKILAALQGLTSLPIKNIRVAKDTLTNTSRGFCYVELNSTNEAVQLHDQLSGLTNLLFVDGKQSELLFLCIL
uniref:RanBP2-type domain-containing protein n=1 Tax=Strigamia maritima TaxID=126957 RepID=T1JJZ8_STRMM